MAPNKKYLSLEEAATQLGIKPDELIRFREKGEVRGFADRGTWKFKADDVAEFRRRRQPDSDPDLPIMDESDDDEDLGRQPTVIRRGRETKSDSDVRLSPPVDSKKNNRLTGTSDEIDVTDSQNSDSDVRLVGSTKSKEQDSDSDVKLVKPKTASSNDSDSDVKMVDLPIADPDSDSDVQLIKPFGSSSDSDSDVRLAGSDSDVRLAPLADSDSDVKLIDRKSPKPIMSDSDSDVMLLPRDSHRGTPIDAMAKTLDSGSGDIDFDLTDTDNNASVLLDADDSSITFSGDSGIRLEGESGIQLAGDSGIRLSGDSGIRLSGLSGIRMGGDSGIRLSDDSGVQLRQPADSGLSLEKMDSGVKLDDSGLSLEEDSGINLMPTGSSKKLKGPGSSKIVKGGSSKNLKGRSGKNQKPAAEHDDLDATSPMLLAGLDDDEGTSPLLSAADSDDSSPGTLELFDESDTSELSSMDDSGQNVVIFEDDEEDAPPVSSKRKKPTIEESIFETDEANDEELEVSDDDLSEDNELDGMAFDEEGDNDESFTTGSSQLRMGSPKVSVAQEVEWSAGFCTLLFVSMCVLITGSMVSADLLRIVHDQSQEPRVYDGVAWLLAGFWK